MKPLDQTRFNNLYQSYFKELILQGKALKLLTVTVDACAKSQSFSILAHTISLSNN